MWLETRLPDAQARAGILRDHCARLPAAIGGVDIDALATATEGLAGADLKRVVEDGKLLFAFDREKKGQTQSASTYFLQAVETVRGNKQLYAEAEARARSPQRPAFFDPMSAIAEMAMSHDITGGGGGGGYVSFGTAQGFGIDVNMDPSMPGDGDQS